jgi:hypothetical protein
MLPFEPWWKSWLSWLRHWPRLFHVRQVLADLRRIVEERWEQQRLRQPARSWRQPVRPRLEVLEERRLFANNAFLPNQLAPVDGSSQANVAAQLLDPATTNLMPSLGLQSASVAAAAQASFTDSGGYSLSLLQGGAYDTNGDRYTFQAGGNVSFSLGEQGSVSNTGTSFSTVSLTETASLSWSFVETNSSGQTVQSLGGSGTFVAGSNGAAPFDGLFPGGFDWYYEMLAVSNAENLGLNNLAADTVSVQETNGSDNYQLQESNGVATVAGSVRQPLSDVLDQTGQNSYTETAVEQYSDTEEGSDSFALSLLGNAGANLSYDLGTVTYQEQGTNTHLFNATVTDAQSGTGSGSGAQSFSGNNHALGASAAQSYQLTSTSTSVYGETATSQFTLAESGSYAGGCFGLNSVTYQDDGSGSSALTQTSVQTQAGTFGDSSNASGTDSYGVAGSLGDGGTSTDAGNFTATSNSTLTDFESGAFTLTEQGGYGNGSWNLSCYNLSESLSGTFAQQQVGTTTQSGQGTSTDSGTSADSYALGFGGADTTSATESATSIDTSTDSFSSSAYNSRRQSGASSCTLSEQGSTQGGVVTLTQYVFTAGQSGSWSATAQSNQTSTGSAQDSSTGSDSGNQSSTFASISISNLGNGTVVSTDTLSFTSTDSSSSSDGGSWSQSLYQSGVYNSGSWSFAAASATSAQSDSWTYQDSQGSSDSGTNTSTATGSTQAVNDGVFGGSSDNNLGNQSYTETSSNAFTDQYLNTTSESGTALTTYGQQGLYGGYSFAYGSVVYQASSSFSGTFASGWTGTNQGSVSDSSTYSASETANSTYTIATAGGVSAALQCVQGTYTALETSTSLSTSTVNDSWTLSQQGSFTGGLWNLGSVAYQETFTSGFSTQQTDWYSDSGTDSYGSQATTNSQATTVYGNGSFIGVGTVLSLSTGTDSYSDAYGQTLTQSGGSTWSTTQRGSFAGECFAFASVVYQGGQTFTQTYSSAETHSFVGTANDSTTTQGTQQSQGAFSGSANSGVDSVTQTITDSFTTSGSSVYGETDGSTDQSSYYQAGSYAGGSFGLSSVSTAETYVASYSYAGADTQVATGPQTQTASGGGHGTTQIGTNWVGITFSQSASNSGAVTDTSTDSYSGSGGQSWTLEQAGSYANFSVGYGTVVYQSANSVTAAYTASESETFTGTAVLANSAAGTLNDLSNLGLSNSVGTSNVATGSSTKQTLVSAGSASSSDRSTDSWGLYESGSYLGGSYNLACVSYGESWSETWSSSASGVATLTGSQTFTATATVSDDLKLNYAGLSLGMGNVSTITSGQTITGLATAVSGGSVVQDGGSSWSLSEQGNYGNWSFAYSSIVYQGVQTAGGTLHTSDGSTVTGTFVLGGAQTQQGSGNNAPGLAAAGGVGTNAVLAGITLGAVNFAGNSLTDTGSSTYQWYDAGSYAGGSYAFASASQTVSASDSWTLVGSTSNTETSTLAGSLSGSGTSSSVVSLGSNLITSLSTNSNTAQATVTSAATATSLGTLTGGDSYTQYTSGAWINGSWSFGCWSYQGADSFSGGSAQTNTLAQTLTASGTISISSANTASSELASYGGQQSYSAMTITDVNVSSSVNGFAGTLVVGDTVTNVQAGTYSETYVASGSCGGGSLALTSMSYQVLSTSSTTQVSSDSRTLTDTLSVTQYQYVSHTGANPADNYSGWNSGTFGQQDTVTSSLVTTVTSLSTYGLYEGGVYGGLSWNLGSYALVVQNLATTVASGGTVSNSVQSGSYAGERTLAGVEFYNVYGTFGKTSLETPQSLTTLVMGFSLVEQGGYANATMNLTCYLYGQQESSVASSTDATSATDTYAGVDTAGGMTASYSGVETSGGSSAETRSSVGSLSEGGSYAGGSFALSAVSFTGSGSDGYSAQDSSSGSWTGSYAGSDSASAGASGSDSWSSTAAGSFAAGSFGLSSYVLQGGGNASSSSASGDQGSELGSSNS